jgi:hypothetical protein
METRALAIYQEGKSNINLSLTSPFYTHHKFKGSIKLWPSSRNAIAAGTIIIIITSSKGDGKENLTQTTLLHEMYVSTFFGPFGFKWPSVDATLTLLLGVWWSIG